ncbi:MAG: Do family serine endopeptidase [Candidatus Latescibacteria bacterium]|nr:Do family serine endopeptidase [Candidatus Latescibacterota bacterium]
MQNIWLVLLMACLGSIPSGAQDYGNLEQGKALLRSLNEAYTFVAAQVKPGVVSVTTEKMLPTQGRNPFQGTPWEQFFGRSGPSRREPQYGLGSGVIVQYEGAHYILTNNHVIEGADQVNVELTDERAFEVEILGTDPKTDLAVLSIEADDLSSLPLGDSAQLQVGEIVMAVGNPLGLQHSVHQGIISALGRDRFGNDEYGSFIQTSADINPGNSGGALVNIEGELIGINTAIATRSGGSDGIGFAIPANLVRNVMEQLIQHGEVRRGWLGVGIGDLDDDASQYFGLDGRKGVLINRVMEGTPAEKAGLKRGDVILQVDDMEVHDATALRNRIAQTKPGSRVELLVWREGKEKALKAKLEQKQDPKPSMQRLEKLGIAVQPLTDELAQQLGFDEDGGILITEVVRGSIAYRKGLRRGDLIIEVNRRPVPDKETFDSILEEGLGRDRILLVILRGDSTFFVVLPIPRD